MAVLIQCSDCGQRLPESEFSKSKARGWQAYCKVCASFYKRRWAKSRKS